MAEFVVRPATLDDVQTYVECHVECLAETYATIMPPAFAAEHRRTLAARVEETRRDWAEWQHAEGGSDRPRVWIARAADGSTVGVARSGPGPEPWEAALGAPAAPVDFELHHLYTRQHTHGSGLGLSLLDQAVGQRDAYLWILHGNARAEHFYRRHGFVADGTEMDCGPTWFHRSMFRMVRRTPPLLAVPSGY